MKQNKQIKTFSPGVERPDINKIRNRGSPPREKKEIKLREKKRQLPPGYEMITRCAASGDRSRRSPGLVILPRQTSRASKHPFAAEYARPRLGLATAEHKNAGSRSPTSAGHCTPGLEVIIAAEPGCAASGDRPRHLPGLLVDTAGLSARRATKACLGGAELRRFKRQIPTHTGPRSSPSVTVELECAAPRGGSQHHTEPRGLSQWG